MANFTYEISAHELDLELCVTSGQVFRWRKTGETWVGADGESWFQVHVASDRYLVASNANETAFRLLFGLEGQSDIPILLERGPELGECVEGLPGLRLMQPASAAETLFCFLCTSNNHLSRITAMVDRLAEHGRLLNPDLAVKAFPTCSQVARITEEELRSKGFGYRAATIPKVAAELEMQGSSCLEELKVVGLERARQQLMMLPGVGPKLADCIALYGLHYKRATPIDTHLWQALVRTYFQEWAGSDLTHSRYRYATEFLQARFGDLAGLAQLYLYLDNQRNWRKRRV